MTLATPPLPPENVAGRVLLRNVPWEAYEMLARANAEGSLRMTYDRGRLEIEVPSLEHERLRGFVGQLIEQYAVKTRTPVLPVGSTTWQRQFLDRGIEADEGYYVSHYNAVVGKGEVNLEVDPPPDLAVEVDLTTSSIDKLSIYASLGVPEVWRLHDDRFDCLHLLPDGTYVAASCSLVFPRLPLSSIVAALEQRQQRGEFEAVCVFAESVAGFPRGS